VSLPFTQRSAPNNYHASFETKAWDLLDVNNYRAIALSNSIKKVLESVLLDYFQSYDRTADDYQFGFKNKHSTSLACSVLKFTIDYHRENGSHVFVCMLGLSKAPNIVNQQINVRWKTLLTNSFLMRNGMHQGSSLSPYLFSVYMRDVSHVIVKSGVGC
jgi:hypothetical protein